MREDDGGTRDAHVCGKQGFGRGEDGVNDCCSACQPASPPSPAAAPAIAKLDEIAALRHGWDSYNAHCIDPRAIDSARHLLAAFAHPPAIVPTTNGGIQLEWHTHDVDVELAITPSGGREFSLLSDDDDELESQVRTLQEENEAMRGLDAEADALQGEVDALTEWQRNVCELLTCEGDRGPLFAEFAEARIHELLAYERAALSSKTETAE